MEEIKLSFSQINMYKRCPAQYKYRYIDGIKIPPKSQSILGTGVHTGLEYGFREKRINGGDDTKIKNIMKDKTVETIEIAVQTEQIDWEEGDDVNVLKDDGVKMIETYYSEVGKKIKPESVEQEFKLTLNSELVLVGKIDLITKKRFIDYKTGGQKPQDDYILFDDQTKIYSSVLNLPGHIHWIIRYKKKDPQIFIQKREVSKEEIEQTLRDVMIIARMIQQNLFYRRNDIRICGWCGYRNLCYKEGGKNG